MKNIIMKMYINKQLLIKDYSPPPDIPSTSLSRKNKRYRIKTNNNEFGAIFSQRDTGTTGSGGRGCGCGGR